MEKMVKYKGMGKEMHAWKRMIDITDRTECYIIAYKGIIRLFSLSSPNTSPNVYIYISIYSSSHYPLSPSDYEQMYFNSTLERVLFVRTTLTPSSINCLLCLSHKTNLSWTKPINKPKCCQVQNGPEHPNQAKPKADG